VTPNAPVACKTIAKDVKARERALDGPTLAVGRAGKVRPKPCELLGEEEAPESEAQLADRLPVACPPALLPHTVTGARDVQARSAAGVLLEIILQDPDLLSRRTPPDIPRRCAQSIHEVADRLPERSGCEHSRVLLGRSTASTPQPSRGTRQNHAAPVTGWGVLRERAHRAEATAIH
jgi:hypothetical protein